MSIPVYLPPLLRSHEPNRFDRDVERRSLRILVDEPLMHGDIDGEGAYHGYARMGPGPTGHPSAAVVLRSFFRSASIEVFHTSAELDGIGAVVVGEPTPGCDEVDLAVQYEYGVGSRGIIEYSRQMQTAAEFFDALGLQPEDALSGVLLCSIGEELEADIVVTGRAWLVDLRADGRVLAPLVSPEGAVALMALYLRWHDDTVILGGDQFRWAPTSMRRSAAFAALPSFVRWNQAARNTCDVTGDDTLHTLTQTLLTRVARALKFRDNVYGLSATMQHHEPEEMLCELDALLLSLVGAFDVAAVFADKALGLNSALHTIGWQNARPGCWHARLQPLAPLLHDYTATGTNMMTMFDVLRRLRNTVHDEALNLIIEDGTYLVTMPKPAQAKLRNLLRAGWPGWDLTSLGVRTIAPAGATASKWLPGVGRYTSRVRRTGAPARPDPLSEELAIDARTFLNRIVPAALNALDEVIQLTPLSRITGYTNAWETPSRANLPWQFSDTTASRLRLLYGL